MAEHVGAAPQGQSTLTPHLVVNDAAAAIAFYRRAFGAEELSRRVAGGGRIVHAELRVGGNRLMLADELAHGECRSPRALGGTTVSLMLYTADVDQAFTQAVEAGARARMEPEDMFWGDRCAAVEDPFGHSWALATRLEDVSPEEARRRARRIFTG